MVRVKVSAVKALVVIAKSNTLVGNKNSTGNNNKSPSDRTDPRNIDINIKSGISQQYMIAECDSWGRGRGNKNKNRCSHVSRRLGIRLTTIIIGESSKTYE